MSELERYDVVIIGAGIQGLGIAEQASQLGKTVLVVEKNSDVGQETSSNSSKLIHGGLRYLETLQLKLVYECLAERKYLLEKCPSLVKIKPFVIPVYETSNRSWWWVLLGLSLYALLGGLSRDNRFSSMPKSQWSTLGIDTNGLKKVYRYYDAQTDDTRLTQWVSCVAESLGVRLLCNTAMTSAKEYQDGYLVQLSGDLQVQTNVLINASGPWVNEIAETIENAPTEPITLVQGSHLVLDFPSFHLHSEEACYYLESPVDGRPFFVLPWKGKIMVGTTETRRDDAHARVEEFEREYLINNFRHYFPDLDADRDSIIGEYSGIRVLPGESGSGSRFGSKPRDTRYLSKSDATRQYLAVYGGKLTSYRASAKKALGLLKV